MTDQDYSLAEMMVIQAAREIAGSGRAFVGMGLPMLAAAVTKLHLDPAIYYSTEVGVADWDPSFEEVDRAPSGVADPILDRGAAYVGDMVARWVDGCSDHDQFLSLYEERFGQGSLDALRVNRTWEPERPIRYGWKTTL